MAPSTSVRAFVGATLLVACGGPPAPSSPSNAPPEAGTSPTASSADGGADIPLLTPTIVINAEACRNVSPPKSADGMSLYEKSCENGDSDGCSKLAGYYFCGAGVAVDPKRAVTYSSRACDLGAHASCANLAVLLMRGAPGVPANPTRAASLLEKACAAGNDPACGNYGMMLMQGIGVAADGKRAETVMTRACDHGDAPSCANLGMLYIAGAAGVAPNPTLGLKYSSMGCDKQNWLACSNVGLIYLEGMGVPKDDARAADLFRRACEHGQPPACANLGVLYMTGRGVTADVTRAKALFRQACDAGNGPACRFLAEM